MVKRKWFSQNALLAQSIFQHKPVNYKLVLARDGTGEGNGTPLQYSCLENPMYGGACEAVVHGAAEEEMATHSGVLAWRIPGTGEPGGLPSMGSHRVGHD